LLALYSVYIQQKCAVPESANFFILLLFPT
jgi:hypothetical protein